MEEILEDLTHAQASPVIPYNPSKSAVLRLPTELFPKVLTFLANQRSVQTRLAYNRELGDFAKYVAARFSELRVLRDFRRDHFIRYKAFLEARGLAPATVSRSLACLSAYFRYLAGEVDEQGSPLMDRDAFYGIKRPRVENVTDTAVLNMDQVQRLLGAVRIDKLSGLFHHAILSTLFGTGRRNSEVRRIKLGDIAEVEGFMVVRLTTKGGKKHNQLLLPEVYASIVRYVNALAAAGVVLSANDYIFQAPPGTIRRAGRPGDPICTQGIYKIVRKYFAEIGIQNSNGFHYRPHSARATYATNLIEAGVPIDELQEDMGHAKIETTRKYVKKARKLSQSPALKLGYFKAS